VDAVAGAGDQGDDQTGAADVPGAPRGEQDDDPGDGGDRAEHPAGGEPLVRPPPRADTGGDRRDSERDGRAERCPEPVHGVHEGDLVDAGGQRRQHHPADHSRTQRGAPGGRSAAEHGQRDPAEQQPCDARGAGVGGGRGQHLGRTHGSPQRRRHQHRARAGLSARPPTRANIEGFRRWVAGLPEVLGVFVTSGGEDFSIHVAVPDNEHLYAFVIDRLTEKPEVADMRTSIVYEHIRTTTVLPPGERR
jgi:hypothetical protein